MIRLKSDEINAIKSSILYLDPYAKIYLFGSRTDPKKRGGDIDILVFSNTLKDSDRLQIKMFIFKQMEEQKIDLIIASDDTDPFVKLALLNGVQL